MSVAGTTGSASSLSPSKGDRPENATANMHHSLSPDVSLTSSSPGAIRRTSLSSLPTVPAIPALDGASLADASSSAHSVRGLNPSAAELLVQRRPSLPILNSTSPSKTLRRMLSSLAGRALPKGFDLDARRKDRGHDECKYAMIVSSSLRALSMYQDPLLYSNGAVEIGSMCVPAEMDGMHMSDYLVS
ncbi:hypothetical protein BDY19DRAFT_1054306 [Irpex rosettiformis]|uniref:Uncharacterized protein n=1 Tax=Irpex rosettiformis TaxID=378272 RepID=A0ACB8UEX8_9APHY|nr:hypothetical protein BDY19DRAFT_1054306 [Irpex rosettiformis]